MRIQFTSLFGRVLSLSTQLLLIMVGLVLGTIVALTLEAYRASVNSLEAEATRVVRLVAQTREQSLAQLLTLRQQRAEGFLMRLQSLCGEPRQSGGFGFSEECTSTLAREFGATEGVAGATLTYRNRRLSAIGTPVPVRTPEPNALAWLVAAESGSADHAMTATLGDLELALLFPGESITRLFQDRSGLGLTGEVFLLDQNARVLTGLRYAESNSSPPGVRVAEPVADCRELSGEFTGRDYRGVPTVHGFRPVRALEGACVDVHIAQSEVVAPAEQLRLDLAWRGGLFALLGALVSLIAARTAAAPTHRLVASARALQAGDFDARIPVGGPYETRELGRAFAAMARDISALVKREQAARREAEAANRSKDEFLAMVSHEMRTPLSAMLGWARLLRTGGLDHAREQRALEAIERSANAQRRLIEDLLDVSRIVSGKLRMIRTPVSLGVITEAALEAVRPLAEERDVRLETQVLERDLVVLGDAQRLQQVVWNLAWNAIKFTPDGGRVRVALTRSGNTAELTMSDTGMGISASLLPHVFDPYRQSESGTRVPHAGLGLGLALVRQLVELHGGSVQALSQGEGEGATFVVRLPLGAAEDQVTGPRAMAADGRPAPPRLTDTRVLVVDDDEGTRQVVRALLEEAGAVVECASNTAAARAVMTDRPPDVVVSDIAMPQEDGYAFMSDLRGRDVAVPAVALTAYARREDAERARAAGFDIHIAKPVDPGRLVQAIASLVRRSSEPPPDTPAQDKSAA